MTGQSFSLSCLSFPKPQTLDPEARLEKLPLWFFAGEAETPKPSKKETTLKRNNIDLEPEHGSLDD